MYDADKSLSEEMVHIFQHLSGFQSADRRCKWNSNSQGGGNAVLADVKIKNMSEEISVWLLIKWSNWCGEHF